MKNLINKFKTIISGIKNTSDPAMHAAMNLSSDPADINERLARMHGENVIKLQLLYEKWVVKETWRIKDEALMLLSGFDPDKTGYLDQTDVKAISELWQHARACVQQGLLQVKNRENEPEQWCVQPLEIYRWAKISRVPVPDNLARLMDFISSTVKPQSNAVGVTTNVDDSSGKVTGKFDRDRENVLGMAVAILAACPDRCRNGNGNVNVDYMVRVINDNAIHWSGDGKPGLSQAAMKDLLEKWLKTVPVSVD